MRCVALSFVLVTAAFAGTNPKATALAKEADRLYKENKYKEAAQTLEQAQALEPTPLYVYNIARALDQAGEIERSLEFYRQYVGLPSDQSQPELVKKANLAMDRLRTLVAKGVAEQQVRDAERDRLEAETRKAEARADAEAAEARRQRKEFEAKEKVRRAAESERLNSRVTLTVAVGAAAGVFLGTGLALGIASQVNRDAFRKAETLADKQRLEGETRVTAAIADVSLVLGVAAGVATFILFPRESPGDVSVAVVPTPSGIAGSIGVRF